MKNTQHKMKENAPKRLMKEYDAFVESTKDPEAAEQILWKEFVTDISDGSFWRSKFVNSEAPNLNDFEITEFSDYKEVLHSALTSRISPLTGKPILWWGTTTGTTGNGTKPIPYCYASFIKRIGFVKAMTGSMLQQIEGKSEDLKILRLFGLGPTFQETTNLPVGSITSFLSAYGSWENLALPREISQSLEIFRQWAPLYALAANVNVIQSPTGLSIASFLEQIVQRRHELAKIFQDLAVPHGLPAPQITSARKQYLLHLLESGEKLSIKSIWPDMQIVYCWQSGSSAILLDRLKPFLSQEIQLFNHAYAATESVITMVGESSIPAGALCTSNVIAEFIELGREIDSRNLLKSWQLEDGKHYEIFVTNEIGLIRYRLHDIVKCMGRYNRVPLVQFSQKEGAVITLGVLHLLQADLVAVLCKIPEKLDGKWIFVPRTDRLGIELIHDGKTRNIARFLEAFDEELSQHNKVFDRLLKSETFYPTLPKEVPSDHKTWENLPKDYHPQAKPLILSDQPCPL